MSSIKNSNHHCSYCKVSGHRINNCKCPSIKIMDDIVMKSTAITQVFPQLGNIFIASKLKNLNSKQLQVLTYLFEIPKNKKHLLKSRENTISLLTDCYFSFVTTNQYDIEIRYHLTEIYQSFIFNPFEPNQEPNTRLLRECADLVYTQMENSSALYFQITTWIARKIEEFHTSRLSYFKSQEFVPHRFDIFCLVQDPEEEKQEQQEQQGDSIYECPICQEEITDNSRCIQTGCNHKFCETCITRQLDVTSKIVEFRKPTCAMCRRPMDELYFNSYDVAQTIHNKYVLEERLLMSLFTI